MGEPNLGAAFDPLVTWTAAAGSLCFTLEARALGRRAISHTAMSPLIKRTRVNAARPDPAAQHWGMLLFESLSAGAMALGMGIAAVLALVGIYGLFVWPLTFWDLTDPGLEKYSSYANTVLWSVFAGGSMAGYWCFSGAAFKDRSKRRNGASARAGHSRR